LSTGPRLAGRKAGGEGEEEEEEEEAAGGGGARLRRRRRPRCRAHPPGWREGPWGAA